MNTIALRGATAVVGIAENHYRRGEAPYGELRLTLQAIVEACADAGISPREIDGFVSYAGGSNDGAVLGGALMVDDVRWSNMMWGGGGGTVAAAINNAAIAIASGQADVVAVYRAMAQQDTGRLGYAKYHYGPHFLAHGVGSPAQVCALRTQRLLEHDGVPRDAMRSLVLAGYAHAQNNPTAQGYGRPLDVETYENSRVITEPFHLFDCSRESDGAVVLIIVSAERAKALRGDPAYILAGAQGAPGGYSSIIDNDEQYSTAGFAGAKGRPGVADRLWSAAGLGPDDIDVTQVYENFSGPAVAALIDHGLVPSGPGAGDVLTVDNLLASSGKLPVNTSGGNIADSFVNGMGLAAEAVRQIRGTSCNQVSGAKTSLFLGGPMAPIVSSTLFAHGDVL
ncbi:transporter [Rhodococcus sp. 14-2686-1-2]|nr:MULTISPECIES: transporter [unclassified Rhodococcus (in: high G+C Gram-positive bacteria)]OZE90755.1 transporter [Rhodococcus sp. 15-1189-1-1a]OZF07726.1 transporter [Rhodococcus sp. 14-2686-1-2]